MRINLFLFCISILFIVSACTESKGPTTIESFPISVVETGDIDFPIIAGHVNGERMWVLSDEDSSGIIDNGITAVGWTSATGEDIIVFPGEDGLPLYAYFENEMVIFSGFTQNSVDVGYVINGVMQVAVSGVPIDPSLILRLQELYSTFMINIEGELAANDMFELIYFGSLLLKITGCAFEGAVAIYGGGIAIPLAITTCSSLFIEAISNLSIDELKDLKYVAEFLGGFSCGASPSLTSCLPLILDELADYLQNPERLDLTDEQWEIMGDIIGTNDCRLCVYQCLDPNTPPPWPCRDYIDIAHCSVGGILMCCWRDNYEPGGWTTTWSHPERCFD